jgi:pyridoxine 4-dehydrogenase
VEPWWRATRPCSRAPGTPEEGRVLHGWILAGKERGSTEPRMCPTIVGSLGGQDSGAMPAMPTSFLGDKPIGRIGLGAMQLAGPHVFGPPSDPDACRAVLHRAVELGVDHIDTAQYYGPDVVNDLIRETLSPYPEDLKLVTKVGARRDESGGWVNATTASQLREDVEANLRALQIERMDLVNLRLFQDERRGDTPLAELLGALEDLRAEGKLDLIGVSNVSVEVVREALDLVEIAQVQNAYSIIDRHNDPVVELCRQRGVAFVPFFPLGSGFTGGHQRITEDPRVQRVSDKHGASASQTALAWLLARYDRMLLIPGTKSVTHLEENLGAANVRLDDDDMAELEDVPQVINTAG